VAVTDYAPADHRYLNIAIVSALFVFVGVPCSSTWAGFGVALKRLLSRPSALRVFNVVMALLLIASTWPVLIEYFERLTSVAHAATFPPR
jgi:threonine/homoserine/homoserine lactone efflux protein